MIYKTAVPLQSLLHYVTELEVELLEEPLVLTGLVLLLQSLSHNLLGLDSLRWLVQCI